MRLSREQGHPKFVSEKLCSRSFLIQSDFYIFIICYVICFFFNFLSCVESLSWHVGSWDLPLWCVLSSFGTQAWLPCGMWDLSL